MNPARDIDGTIAWREAGEGEVVVFLHGLGGSRTAWEAQLEDLSDRWRCVAWDMPGYGASAPIDDLSFSALADAVARLLDELGVERAHLCGLSFGGQQALHAALRQPDRVRSLVLADTSPAFGLDGTDPDEWRAARTAPLDAGLTPADMAPGVLQAVAGPGFAGPELDRAIGAFARITSQALRSACRVLPTHDVIDRLGDIAAPTLVIVGELDTETPRAYSERLVAGIPRSRLAVIDGAGHLTPSEAPEEFNRLVRDFLHATTLPS